MARKQCHDHISCSLLTTAWFKHNTKLGGKKEEKRMVGWAKISTKKMWVFCILSQLIMQIYTFFEYNCKEKRREEKKKWHNWWPLCASNKKLVTYLMTSPLYSLSIATCISHKHRSPIQCHLIYLQFFTYSHILKTYFFGQKFWKHMNIHKQRNLNLYELELWR